MNALDEGYCPFFYLSSPKHRVKFSYLWHHINKGDGVSSYKG